MNLKRTAAIAVSGAALAAWLAAAATSGIREGAPPVVERTMPIDGRGEALADEVMRLRERLRPSATPNQPGRNLFAFPAPHPRAAPATGVLPAPAAVVPAVPVAQPPPLRLIGIAEDPGPDGPVRTAIVSTPGELFLVREGQNVTPRYRVARVSTEVVELADVTDGSTVRLVLK